MTNIQSTRTIIMVEDNQEGNNINTPQSHLHSLMLSFCDAHDRFFFNPVGSFGYMYILQPCADE